MGDAGNSRPGPLLSAGGLAPNLPRKYYYFNRSQAINLNNLINTKHDWQLRANLQAFLDRNTLTYTSQQNNYLANDTIRYNEQQNLLNKPFLVNSSFYVICQCRHLYSTQAHAADLSYLFTDANLRYKLSKWRLDLELDVINLANVKKYETLNLNAYQFTVSNFQLRGRMAVIRATFNL